MPSVQEKWRAVQSAGGERQPHLPRACGTAGADVATEAAIDDGAGEVARRMRARGKPKFEVADIFMDFNAIQVTLAVMAQALIDGRIECKTAGRLAVGLQTFSKLLWMMQSKGTSTTEARRHGEEPSLPQISADERTEKASTSKGSKEREVAPEVKAGKKWAANQRENTRTSLRAEVLASADIRVWAHGPPGWARAA